MKNKIYAKLYEFCDIKTWVKDTDKDNHIKYYSKFYKEYKLEFQNKECGWFYKIYKFDKYSEYEINSCQKKLVTLNKTGKFLMALGILLLIGSVRWILYGLNMIIPNNYFYIFGFIPNSLLYIFGFIAFSFLFSFLCISIFNWKFYRSLRKVQYFIRNKDNIKKREEDEALDKYIVTVINDTIAKNPKLARKTKLEQLNKKSK